VFRKAAVAILIVLLPFWSLPAAAGDGCQAVEDSAEAAANYYTQEYTNAIIENTYTPAQPLGWSSCVALIQKLTAGLTFNLPDIIINAIISQVQDAVCQAAKESINNVINSIVGDLLTFDLPYGMGRYGVSLSIGGEAGVTTNLKPIKPPIPTIPVVPPINF